MTFRSRHLPFFLAACFSCFIGHATPSSTTAAETSASPQKPKPNIIFIMADDIGYGDLSCYGSKHVKTPNLDRLASTGRRFLDAHSPATTCTPTRRALLTGVYSWRQTPASSIAPGDAALGIDTSSATVASLLKSAGYKTGLVGKWHLGLGPEGGPDWNGDIKPGPLELGFDYGFFMAATGDRVPTVYVENHRIVGLDPKDPIKVDYKQKVGTEPTGSENPELLKLKHTHGHDMTIVNGVGRIGWMTGGQSARWKDEDMSDSFARKAISFIESSRDKPFFLYYAPHNIHVPRVPHPRFKGASGVGIRGDAILELDDAVGQVLKTLEDLQLTKNTLIVFTSDNGGVMDDGYEDTGSFDYNPNAPLKGYKGSLYEGGHRVPFIATWPGHIPAGSESSALIAHLDMPATFASLTGVTVPAGQCRDSINVWSTFTGDGKAISPRETFITHNGGTKGPFAVRHGQLKFIEGFGAGGGGGGKGGQGKNAVRPKESNRGGNQPPIPPVPGPQVYDLSTDLAEQQNLAESKPELVKQLRDLLIQSGARQPSPAK